MLYVQLWIPLYIGAYSINSSMNNQEILLQALRLHKTFLLTSENNEGENMRMSLTDTLPSPFLNATGEQATHTHTIHGAHQYFKQFNRSNSNTDNYFLNGRYVCEGENDLYRENIEEEAALRTQPKQGIQISKNELSFQAHNRQLISNYMFVSYY